MVHSGSRLLAPDAEVWSSPERFKDAKSIYPQLEHLSGPAMTTPMTVEECRDILELLESLPLVKEGDWVLFRSG